MLFISVFHAGWFVESLWSQTLVIHMLRTPKMPFLQSRASAVVTAITTISILVGTLLPYTSLGKALKMSPLPLVFYPWLIGTIIVYMILVTLLKKVYIKKNQELL